MEQRQFLTFDDLDAFIALGIALYFPLMVAHPVHSAQTWTGLVIGAADIIFGCCFVLLWHGCFRLLDLYERAPASGRRVMGAVKGVCLMMLPFAVFFKTAHRSLLSIRLLALISLTLVLWEVTRTAASFYLPEWMASRRPRRATIVGSGPRAGKAWREIRVHHHSSIELVGFVDTRAKSDMSPDMAHRHLGGLDELRGLLHHGKVNTVLLAMPMRSCYALMQQAVDIAEQAGAQVIYLQDIHSSSRRFQPGTAFQALRSRQVTGRGMPPINESVVETGAGALQAEVSHHALRRLRAGKSWAVLLQEAAKRSNEQNG